MTPLPARVLQASRQKEKVAKLVDWCRRVDGTEVEVVELPKEIDDVPHPYGTELAVRYAGQLFDHPWIYLEADSIPIKPGWRAAISEEYSRAGKPWMLPDLSFADEGDVASAIGVFPPNAHRYFSDNLGPPFFDLVIYNQPELVHFTRLVQHRYGFYESGRLLRRPEFPRDRQWLRPEAMIFHADPTQSIIRGALLQSFYHSGDLGDIIAALPIIRHQGGGKLFIGPHDTIAIYGKNPREGMNEARFDLIADLLRAQPYLNEVTYCPNSQNVEIDHDLSKFRLLPWNHRDNLGEWQARLIGRENLNMDPWLSVPPSEWHGRVVVTRSPRYHNLKFPWQRIASVFGDQLLFVGLPDEHKEFENHVGRTVEYAQTKTLLDAAQILNGAELQFSNQSAAWWLGAGLGKKVVQETCLTEMNSIIKRDGLLYSRTIEENLKIQSLSPNREDTLPSPILAS